MSGCQKSGSGQVRVLNFFFGFGSGRVLDFFFRVWVGFGLHYSGSGRVSGFILAYKNAIFRVKIANFSQTLSDHQKKIILLLKTTKNIGSIE